MGQEQVHDVSQTYQMCDIYLPHHEILSYPVFLGC